MGLLKSCVSGAKEWLKVLRPWSLKGARRTSACHDSTQL